MEESYHRLPHLVTLGFSDSVVLISPSLFQHSQPPQVPTPHHSFLLTIVHLRQPSGHVLFSLLTS